MESLDYRFPSFLRVLYFWTTTDGVQRSSCPLMMWLSCQPKGQCFMCLTRGLLMCFRSLMLVTSLAILVREGEGWRGGGGGEFADEVHKCLYPKPLPLCLK